MIEENCPRCGYKDNRIISTTSLADKNKEEYLIELYKILEEYEVREILELAREGKLLQKIRS